jgi:hypothetical protein
MVMPSLSAAAHLPPSRFGVGRAVNQAVRQIGAVLGVALAVALAQPTVAAFAHLFWWQAGLAVGVALLCLPVDTRPRQSLT